MDYKKLPELISKMDINLAPLTESIFNEAKSEIKWIEASLVKTCTIASNLGAFKEKQLVNVIKRPGVDRLVYGAGFDGGKVMMVIADFAVNNEKPLLLNIAIVPPQPPQDQAQADQNK